MHVIVKLKILLPGDFFLFYFILFLCAFAGGPTNPEDQKDRRKKQL